MCVQLLVILWRRWAEGSHVRPNWGAWALRATPNWIVSLGNNPNKICRGTKTVAHSKWQWNTKHKKIKKGQIVKIKLSYLLCLKEDHTSNMYRIIWFSRSVYLVLKRTVPRWVYFHEAVPLETMHVFPCRQISRLNISGFTASRVETGVAE